MRTFVFRFECFQRKNRRSRYTLVTIRLEADKETVNLIDFILRLRWTAGTTGGFNALVLLKVRFLNDHFEIFLSTGTDGTERSL